MGLPFALCSAGVAGADPSRLAADLVVAVAAVVVPVVAVVTAGTGVVGAVAADFIMAAIGNFADDFRAVGLLDGLAPDPESIITNDDLCNIYFRKR